MAFPMGIVRRRKVVMVTHGRLPRSHYRPTKKTVRSAPPLRNMMKYAVPAVLALRALQYQRKPHPAALWCFAAATIAYWLILGAMKRRETRRRYFHTAALASGILSALSLLSILLPHSVSQLPLLIWLLFALIWAIYRSPIIAEIKAFANWARDRGLSSINPRLPV